jgi:choline dehydrogenase
MKIDFSGTSLPLTATGVQFKATDNSGSIHTAFARREVIIAAGAIQSPTLLQLSGIGDPAVLNPLNIRVLSPLTAVGRNLQEQALTAIGWETRGFDPAGLGPSNAIAFPNMDQLFGNQSAVHKQTIRSNLASWAASQAGSALSADALLNIYNIQADNIVNKSAPIVEMFFDTGYPRYAPPTLFLTQAHIT